MRKVMMMVFLVIIVVLAGFWGLVRYLEQTAIFFPGHVRALVPTQAGLAFEDLYITTADGARINLWFLKNPHARSTLIFAHGNAGTMSDRIMKVKFFYIKCKIQN